MPYDNKYNRAIGEKVRQVNQKHIDKQNAENDNAPDNDPVTSQVESMVLKDPDIVGGNGYAAATLGDFGYEPTLGAVGEAKPKRARKKKGEGVAAAGMGAGLAAAGMAAAGVSGGRKRCKEQGGALLTVQDIDKMHGQPPLAVDAKITVQAKPYNAEIMGSGREVGAGVSGGSRKKRNDLVKEIMKSKGMSLPEASKHIKANNLY